MNWLYRSSILDDDDECRCKMFPAIIPSPPRTRLRHQLRYREGSFGRGGENISATCILDHLSSQSIIGSTRETLQTGLLGIRNSPSHSLQAAPQSCRRPRPRRRRCWSRHRHREPHLTIARPDQHTVVVYNISDKEQKPNKQISKSTARTKHIAHRKSLSCGSRTRCCLPPHGGGSSPA